MAAFLACALFAPGSSAAPARAAPSRQLTAQEAAAVEGLVGKGYRVDPAQAFHVTLSGIGEVDVAVACDLESQPRCRIGAVRDGKLYAARGEPTSEENTTWACSPAALGFKDLDGNGPEDLLLMMACMTGIGPEGAHEFLVGRVLLWRGTEAGAGRLEEDPRVQQALARRELSGGPVKTLRELEQIARRALAAAPSEFDGLGGARFCKAATDASDQDSYDLTFLPNGAVQGSGEVTGATGVSRALRGRWDVAGGALVVKLEMSALPAAGKKKWIQTLKFPSHAVLAARFEAKCGSAVGPPLPLLPAR